MRTKKKLDSFTQWKVVLTKNETQFDSVFRKRS
jgi:hypothetical protein